MNNENIGHYSKHRGPTQQKIKKKVKNIKISMKKQKITKETIILTKNR